MKDVVNFQVLLVFPGDQVDLTVPFAVQGGETDQFAELLFAQPGKIFFIHSALNKIVRQGMACQTIATIIVCVQG